MKELKLRYRLDNTQLPFILHPSSFILQYRDRYSSSRFRIAARFGGVASSYPTRCNAPWIT